MSLQKSDPPVTLNAGAEQRQDTLAYINQHLVTEGEINDDDATSPLLKNPRASKHTDLFGVQVHSSLAPSDIVQSHYEQEQAVE